MGPFLKGTAQKKFLLVVVEYFSKWVEAEALASITEAKVMDFMHYPSSLSWANTSQIRSLESSLV